MHTLFGITLILCMLKLSAGKKFLTLRQKSSHAYMKYCICLVARVRKKNMASHYPQEIVTNESEVLCGDFLKNVTPALSFLYVKYVVTQ